MLPVSGETSGEDGTLSNGKMNREGLREFGRHLVREWIFIMAKGYSLSEEC